MAASTGPNPGSSPKASGANLHSQAVLRNTIKFTLLSADEYAWLYRVLIARSKALRRSTPSVARVERLLKGNAAVSGSSSSQGSGDFNAAAVRASVRVFLGTKAALGLYELLKQRFLGAQRPTRSPKQPIHRNTNTRLALSLSMILLFHRLLYRFFTRLRATLLAPSSLPFRQRNPLISKTLTFSLAPALGASLSGFWLGLYEKGDLRLTLAIYTASRAAELAWNAAESKGLIWGKFTKGQGEGGSYGWKKGWERPWWWGSWMLMPLACGQLLHAFVFDRDCFPTSYGAFIMKNSPEYLHPRPVDFPPSLSWPGTYDIVDSIAEIHRLNHPPFISPILFPGQRTLPPSLSNISPITSPAHPSIPSLSCALLHPHDPSCLRTYLTYYIRSFPSLFRFFLVVFSVFSLPKYRSFYKAPITSLSSLFRSVLRMSTFITGAIGTSWASICLFSQFLPAKTLPTQRIFWGGFLGGLWGFLEKEHGRSKFLYSARMSADSLYKVGRKRGWWRPVKGGDLAVVVLSMMVINAVWEGERDAVDSAALRGLLQLLRGEEISKKKVKKVEIEEGAVKIE